MFNAIDTPGQSFPGGNFVPDYKGLSQEQKLLCGWLRDKNIEYKTSDVDNEPIISLETPNNNGDVFIESSLVIFPCIVDTPLVPTMKILRAYGARFRRVPPGQFLWYGKERHAHWIDFE